VARAFEPLSKAVVKQIAELGSQDQGGRYHVDDGIVIKCMKKDRQRRRRSAEDIYRRLRPGDPPTAANARALISGCSSTPNAMTWTGRPLQDQPEMGIKDDPDSRILTKEDLIAATKYPAAPEEGRRQPGRYRSFGHRRIRRRRTSGQSMRVGLARTERLVKGA